MEKPKRMDQRTSLAKARFFIWVKSMTHIEHLTINQVAKELNCHPNTVRQHLADWGFFKMAGSRVWRVKRSDIDRVKKQANNDRGVSLSVEEKRKCRSTDEKQTVRGGLISQPQTARELREALARL